MDGFEYLQDGDAPHPRCGLLGASTFVKNLCLLTAVGSVAESFFTAWLAPKSPPPQHHANSSSKYSPAIVSLGCSSSLGYTMARRHIWSGRELLSPCAGARGGWRKQSRRVSLWANCRWLGWMLAAFSSGAWEALGEWCQIYSDLYLPLGSFRAAAGDGAGEATPLPIPM